MKTRKTTDMDSKRKATSDLNHENWDMEEEPEDKGTFQTASEDEIKRRVIKKARRKITEGDDGPPNKSVFGGFAGFTTSTATGSTVSGSLGSPFSFLSKITPSSTANAESKTAEKKSDDDNKKFSFEKSKSYYAKLIGLNQTVSNWIKTHVDKNPLCILTPIFNDYEKYLKEIQDEKPEGATAATVPDFKFGSLPATGDKSPASSFTFQTNAFSSGGDAKIPTSPFAKSSPDNKPFKTPSDTAEPATSKTSIFSNASSVFSGTNSDSSGFSFSASKPFTFGSSVTKPFESSSSSATKEDGTAADEDDEPPKVEFKAVVEEDSIYSKKCKIFVKADGNFAERGIGMLYLKPVKDKDKTQLIVRADTNLGNILLNIILNESIPAQRLGKNNVMLVCIPTPESEPKPTSVLLRVKTGDEADELLATINKYKK